MVHLYTTIPKHDNTPYLNAGLSLLAVCSLFVKIPLFAFLEYFLRLYRCFWYNYTFTGYKWLK